MIIGGVCCAIALAILLCDYKDRDADWWFSVGFLTLIMVLCVVVWRYNV